MAKAEDRNSYEPAKRGYLYFKLPKDGADLARREWSDLEAVAGTRQVVSFGNRHMIKTRVRAADEKPDAPDAYFELMQGVVKVRSDTDYAPIRSVVEHAGR